MPTLHGTVVRNSYATTNRTALTGTDEICRTAVRDPATAGELWLAGEETTHAAADPTCLRRAVKAAQAAGSGRLMTAVTTTPDATTVSGPAATATRTVVTR